MWVTLYNDKYCSVSLDEEGEFYEYHWYSATETMNDEDFKEVIKNISAPLEGKKLPRLKALLNNRDFLFSISPDLQEWHARFVTAKVRSTVENPALNKTAMIVSTDFINQLSIEQTMDENEETNNYGEVRYFTEVEEARAWLRSV